MHLPPPILCRHTSIIALGFVTALISLTGCSEQPGRRFTLQTATQGGTYERFGTALEAATGQLAPSAARLFPQTTQGTNENIDTVLDERDPCFALVSGNGILAHERRNAFLTKARLVAPLYQSFLHAVAAPRHNNQTSLADFLAGHEDGESQLKIYVGKLKSGTRPVAVEILATFHKAEEYEVVHSDLDVGTVLNKLASDDSSVDLVFTFSGLPNPSVEQSMERGCALLSIDMFTLEDPPDLKTCSGQSDRIPTLSYPKQSSAVLTLVEQNYLVCREDVDSQSVHDVLHAIVEHPQTMEFYHPTAGIAAVDLIKLALDLPDSAASSSGSHGLKNHEGTIAYLDDELENAYFVLGGPPGGRYIDIAESIALALRDIGLTAYAIPTEGSQQNIEYLKAADGRNCLAVAQYDLSFRAATLREMKSGAPASKVEKDTGQVPLYFLGALHREYILGFARKAEKRSLMDIASDPSAKIAVGHSGGGAAGTLEILFPSVAAKTRVDIDVSLFDRALNEDIVDAVLIVGEPNASHVWQLISKANTFQEIPLSSNLVHVARRPTITIELDEERDSPSRPSGATLATKAVLLGTKQVATDETIATQIIKQSENLGFERASFAKPLVGLTVTDTWDNAREELSLIDRHRIDWLTRVGEIAGVLVAVGGIASALIYTYNTWRAGVWTRKVLSIDLSSKNKKPVKDLSEIEEEIRGNVGNTLFELNVMSPSKWSELQGFLQLRRLKAEESYQREVAGTVKTLRGRPTDKIADLEQNNADLSSALSKAWKLFSDAELSLERFQEIEIVINNSIRYNESLIAQRRKA